MKKFTGMIHIFQEEELGRRQIANFFVRIYQINKLIMQGKTKKPQIEYRVELEKKIEINKSFSERRNQAVAMRIMSYGLFGQKRYQNLYLTCSLNCFHLALKIANAMHTRVAGLAMIIRFETVQVLEYYAEEVDGKYFEEKRFSKIIIKLTKCPTEDDRKQPGFNPGLSTHEIDQPLTEVMQRKNYNNGQRYERNSTFTKKQTYPRNQKNNDTRTRQYRQSTKILIQQIITSKQKKITIAEGNEKQEAGTITLTMAATVSKEKVNDLITKHSIMGIEGESNKDTKMMMSDLQSKKMINYEIWLYNLEMYLDDKSEELEEIIKLKTENTRIKLAMENIKSSLASKQQRIEQLTQKLINHEQMQEKAKEKLNQILRMISSFSDQAETNLLKLLTKLQQNLRQNKQEQEQIKQNFKQLQQISPNVQEKQSRLNELTHQLQTKQQLYKQQLLEQKKQQDLLGQYAKKISSLEIELKDARSSPQFQGGTLKRECEEMIESLGVRNDDYLKSYLLKNCRQRNDYGVVSRKNKYDFIFNS